MELPRSWLAAAVLVAVAIPALPSRCDDAPRPAGSLRFVPEPERPLGTLVVGTNAHNGRYFMLPELGPLPGLTPKERQELQSELFNLDVELSHGALFSRLPSTVSLYVAVPEPGDGRAGGEEIASFRRYLVERCGWKPADVERRVRFFEVPAALVWTRDAGKVLGYDDKDRVVIATGSSDHPLYRDFVARLTKAFPDRFAAHELGRGVSSEGGDIALARMPDNTLAYFVGHHRFLKYFGRSETTGTLTAAEIREAQEAFSRSLLGIPVRALPEAALTDRELGAPELFHLDMVTSFLARNGRADAFVPTYAPAPVDRMSGQELPPEMRSRVQREYDEVARQLADLGYRVRRVPFADHPARPPVNVMKFADVDGRPSVLLAKYPHHLPADDPGSPQARMNRLLQTFRDDAAGIRPATGKAAYNRWREAFRAIWKDLPKLLSSPSPSFEVKRKIFEEQGYRVVEVPMYAWGGGGLHCITMH